MNNKLRFEDNTIQILHTYSEGTVRFMKGLGSFFINPLVSTSYHLKQNLTDIITCQENYDVGFYRVHETGYDYSELLKLGSHNLFCGVILSGTFVDDMILKSGTVSLKTNRLFLKNFIEIF